MATDVSDMRGDMPVLTLLVQEELGRDRFVSDVVVFRDGGSLLFKTFGMAVPGYCRVSSGWVMDLARGTLAMTRQPRTHIETLPV